MSHSHFKSLVVSAMTLAACSTAFAGVPSSDVVCSFAPSQSKVVTGISSGAGGAAATTAAVASALGLSVLTHSSGALILAGSGGYIAGTLGTAVVAPAIIVLGVAVAGTAVTVELLCAPKNHPEGRKKVFEAANEFRHRTGSWVQSAKNGATDKARTAVTVINVKTLAVKGKAVNMYRRVFHH